MSHRVVVQRLARQGIQILRVHDVAHVRHALLLFEAVGGLTGREARIEDDATKTHSV